MGITEFNNIEFDKEYTDANSNDETFNIRVYRKTKTIDPMDIII